MNEDIKKEDGKKTKAIIALTVIIAMVIVLFAVFTPIGLKHIEQSRRQLDIAKAKEIELSVKNDAKSEHPTIVFGTPVTANPDTVPGLKDEPRTEGDAVEKGIPFTYYYVKQGDSCAVYIGDDRTYNLANESQQEQYLNAK